MKGAQPRSFTVHDGRRRGGWFWLDNALIDNHAAHLGPYALAIYMALARLADGEARCWPSTRTLLKLTGIGSLSTLYKALHSLVDAGLITVETRRDAAGDAATNVYTLLDLRAAAANETAAGDEGGVTPTVTGVTPAVTGVTPTVTGCYTCRNTGVTAGVKEQYLYEQDTINNRDSARDARTPAPSTPNDQPGVGDPQSQEDSPPSSAPSTRKARRSSRSLPTSPQEPAPAVATFRSIFRRWPNAIQKDAIIEAVTDLKRWEAVLRAWALRGYNPTNVTGMLDWYRKGIPTMAHNDNGSDNSDYSVKSKGENDDGSASTQDDEAFTAYVQSVLERQKRNRAERERIERERLAQRERERAERERIEREERLARLRAEREHLEHLRAQREAARRN